MLGPGLLQIRLLLVEEGEEECVSLGRGRRGMRLRVGNLNVGTKKIGLKNHLSGF